MESGNQRAGDPAERWGALKAGGKKHGEPGTVPRTAGQRCGAADAGGLPARQDGDDARPARVSGVDVYLPVQVGDDQAAEVEPEAVALAEGVEFGETLEDIAVLLGRDAAARVGDGDEDAVVAQTVAFEADRAFLREFIGVAEQCRDEYRQVFVAGVERNLRDRDRAFVNDARLRVPHLHDPQLRLAYGAEVRILARQRRAGFRGRPPLACRRTGIAAGGGCPG